MSRPTPLFTSVGSVEVGDAPKPGESRPRRLTPTAAKLVHQPFEGIDTIADVLPYAARTHGTKKAIGWRDIVKVVEEEKEIKKTIDGKVVTQMKTWKYFQLSEFKYLSFIEVKDAVTEIAKGFVELGIDKGEVLNLYASTSANWQMVAHAAASISTTIATAYDTLGESGLTHSLNEPGCVAIFTNGDLLPTLSRVLANTPTVRVVIYDGEVSPQVLEALQHENRRIITLQEVRELGKDKPEITGRTPTPEDVSCIMYTSGTTGAPKGVVLTHANLVASIGAVYTLLGHVFRPDDTFLAFLPLAHILEYIVEVSLFFVGFTTGYGRIKTLTDVSVRNCAGDIREFRPSIMVGVPAVWETIRKGIIGRVNKMSGVKKSVFNASMSIKKANVPVLRDVVDAVVLNAIKEQTGGRLRYALSGGAAISKETQEFLSLALVTVLQGYGMTESCGMCAILPPELFTYGTVGVPVPSIEIKLLDVPEAGYFATRDPPQGEILIRGPSVTKGYYKRDDLNSDPSIFPGDGWLRTGDVGRWNKDGTLSVIDRVKNLVKLSGGEYIALERLESSYKSCNLVSNICVHATSESKQPIAVIFPHEANLRHALEQIPNGPNPKADIHDLCHDPAVVSLVLKECNVVGKKNDFKSIEILQGVVLTPEEWTPENGLVTAAQKVQRKKIEEHFSKEIKEANAAAGN